MPLVFYKKSSLNVHPLYRNWGCTWWVEGFCYCFPTMFIVFPWCSDHIYISEYIILLKKWGERFLRFMKKIITKCVPLKSDLWMYLMGWGVSLWVFSHVYSLSIVFWSNLHLWVYYLAQKWGERLLSFIKISTLNVFPLYRIWGCTWWVESFDYGFPGMFIVFPLCSNQMLISEYVILPKKWGECQLIRKTALNVFPSYQIWGCTWWVDVFYYDFPAMFTVFSWCSDYI